MNFIVSASTLLKNLKAIGGLLTTNSSMPILENFLFEISNDSITITASDLETTVSTVVKAESNSPGTIAIPGKTLMETLSNFPEQPITFSVDKSNFGIKIITDNGEYKLAGFNGEDFPKVPLIEDSSSLDIKTDVLMSAINKSLFAASNDDLRPVMTGIFCNFGENESLFVATDAQKLVRYRRADAKATNPASFILPKKPLQLLKNLLAGIDDVVTVTYNQKNANFKFTNVDLSCRLIEGKYPNYEAVIPKGNPNKLMVDRSSLLGALKRVAIYSNKATHQVRFSIKGSALDIFAEDVDFASEAHERLTCVYEGEDLEIGFNSKYFIEMLTNIDSPEVRMELSYSNRPGIIYPGNGSNPEEDILMVIMPIMLSN